MRADDPAYMWLWTRLSEQPAETGCEQMSSYCITVRQLDNKYELNNDGCALHADYACHTALHDAAIIYVHHANKTTGNLI